MSKVAGSMTDKMDVEGIVDLLPKQLKIPTHLRNHKDYKFWKQTALPELYPVEYGWLSQYSSRGQDMLADVLDEYFPVEFQLKARQVIREGWNYAAEFTLRLLEIIRAQKLYETVLIIQRGKNYDENLILVKPIMGEFIGKLPIDAGIRIQ